MYTKWHRKMSHLTMHIHAKIDVCILNFPKQSVTYFPQISVQVFKIESCCANKTVPSMIKCCTFPQDSNSIMHAEVYMVLNLPPEACRGQSRGDHQGKRCCCQLHNRIPCARNRVQKLRDCNEGRAQFSLLNRMCTLESRACLIERSICIATYIWRAGRGLVQTIWTIARVVDQLYWHDVSMSKIKYCKSEKNWSPQVQVKRMPYLPYFFRRP